MDEVVIGMTGASGIIYGTCLLRHLRELGIKTHLIITSNASDVIKKESSLSKDEIEKLANWVHDPSDFSACIASGSYIGKKRTSLVIVPCSMKTLAAIAHGYSDNLLIRVADVFLKEKKPIVLVPRETPLNVTHLENMLKLASRGIWIIPPIHAFYTSPKTIDDLVSQFIGRILTILGISNDLHVSYESI
ncbi:MAG: UbiX family flavin prenyltransferase [Candidatus Helarchaeales archaeon]